MFPVLNRYPEAQMLFLGVDEFEMLVILVTLLGPWLVLS